MSESIYLKKGLKDALSIHFITTSDQFQYYWQVYRYMRWLASDRLVTPEIRNFCDKDVIDKILREDNEYLALILHESLQNTTSYLSIKGKKFRLGVYLYSDPDMPEWEGFTMLINVDYDNFDEKMSLWTEIEGRITKIFDKFKEKYPEHLKKIEKANEIIATTIQKLPK